MIEKELIESIERNCPDCVDGIGDVEEDVQFSGGEVVAFGYRPQECKRCWPIIKNIKKEFENG